MSQCFLGNHQIKLWCLKVVESTEFGYSGDKQPELHWYPKDMGKVYLWYTDPVWLSVRLPPLCHQHNHLPAKSSCPLASGTINELSWVLSEKSRLLSKARVVCWPCPCCPRKLPLCLASLAGLGTAASANDCCKKKITKLESTVLFFFSSSPSIHVRNRPIRYSEHFN